jgi:endonuclease/exonuclease/phosphatase family metal-dependent hydrolase
VQSFRLIVYNMRYATGSGATFNLPMPGAGYLRDTQTRFRRLCGYLRSLKPDVLALVEVDSGSLRSGRVNQAEAIAEALGSHGAHWECKYAPRSLMAHLPVVRKQANAFVTRGGCGIVRFHYFETGVKRLLIELEFEGVRIFLVHLSLKYRHRHYQLSDLYDLVSTSTQPVLVAGDFNTLWGDYEIKLFSAATRLKTANIAGEPTYPSLRPRKQLDFILASPEIEIRNFRILHVRYSDHLPLVCDCGLIATDLPHPPATA